MEKSKKEKLEEAGRLLQSKDYYLDEMTEIATSHSGLDIDKSGYLSPEDTSMQLKYFVLSLARKELVRVVRLTNALDELETVFINEALENKDDLNLGTLNDVMKTVTNSLTRSVELIYKVIEDDTLKLIVNNSTNIFNASNSQSVVVLEDPASREKVKNLANELLKYIDFESRSADE